MNNIMGIPVFKFTPEYNLMADSIKNSDLGYQYFKGIAFYKPEVTKIAENILIEINTGLSKLNETYSYDKRYSTTALRQILNKKISEYQEREERLFNDLTRRSKIKNFPIVYNNKMSIKEKINAWDRLFNHELLEGFDEKEIVDFSKNGNTALYCFLMSDELYDYLKNSSYITTVLSRKQWADAYLYEADYKTKTGKKQIEQEMWNVFRGEISKKNGFGEDMWSAISRGFDDALSEIIKTNKKIDKNQYLEIVEQSYSNLQIKIGGRTFENDTGYRYLHDKLKEWGVNIFQEINRVLEQEQRAKGIKEPVLLTKVEIGRNNISFFTIENEGEENALNNRLEYGLISGISNFIANCYFKKEKNFALTVLPYKKRLFTSETALAARRKISSFLTSNNISNAIKNYIIKNGGTKKIAGLKSNSIVSGILGELALLLKMLDFGIEGQLTGSLQQYYNKGGSFIGMVNPNSNPNKWKSSGQAYSDFQYQGELSFGVNIKRYITDKNSFTLTSFQNKGIDLNSIYLRRYLTEKEIALLKFVQANYKLLSENNIYPKLGQNKDSSAGIKRIAEFVMNANIPAILRIESAGFDIVNYIIAANGHFIPASCILQYALTRILDAKKAQDKLYEIKNTSGIDYVDLQLGSGIPKNKNNVLNVNNLMIDNVVKKNKALIYRFNDFKVSISELLKL